jgi:hypothetical protein
MAIACRSIRRSIVRRSAGFGAIDTARRRAESRAIKGASMHIAIVVGVGLMALAVFYFAAAFFGHSGIAGARVFIGVWMVAALLNGAVGVARANIPVVNEIAAFIPTFGIPAAVAWFLVWRYGV